MDVKSNLLPKGMSGPPSAPQPQPKRDPDDEKKLSTDVPPLSSSSPSKIREALVSALLNRPSEINRFYDGTFQPWTVSHSATVTGSYVNINTVTQGTGWTQRLGDSIRMRRLRFCLHARQINPANVASATGVVPNEEFSNAFRLIILIDKMPVIGAAVYTDTGSYDVGGVPISAAATHTSPRADFKAAGEAFPGAALLTVRNPQTISRYHVLYDEIHNVASKYNAGVITSVGGAYLNGQASKYVRLDIPLHGVVTQWYDQGNNNAIFINALRFFVAADAEQAHPIEYQWLSELEFENVP